VGGQKKRVEEGKKRIKTNNYKVNHRQSYIETSSARRVGKCSEICGGELKRKRYIHKTF
jgi:hypothetical protein